MLGKIVLDNWENGLPEHKVRPITRSPRSHSAHVAFARPQEKVRKVLDIWTKASTFSSSTIAKISSKLLATASTSAAAPAAPRAASPGRPSLSPGKCSVSRSRPGCVAPVDFRHSPCLCRLTATEPDLSSRIDVSAGAAFRLVVSSSLSSDLQQPLSSCNACVFSLVPHCRSSLPINPKLARGEQSH